MAKITVEKHRTTMLEITSSNNTVISEKGDTFDSQGHGIVESGSPGSNEYRINGAVIAHGAGNYALSFDGTATDVTVGENGKLKSQAWALRAFGDQSEIVNNGRIVADTIAVAVGGDGMHIVNHGSIVSASGYAIDTMNLAELRLDNSGTMDSKFGLDFRIQDLKLNFSKGSIVEFGADGTIKTNTQDGWVAHIHNQGEITNTDQGMISAISGGAGRELVRNSGSITGLVDLDAGDDRYDGRGGRVYDGAILGGDGNDTYLISNSKDRVHDSVGWGYDKLKLSCSYNLGVNNEIEETRLMGKGDFDVRGNALNNILIGNRGDNRLIGAGGQDTFLGGAGKDVMTGGADIDDFYFKTHAGVDIITDFTDGEDLLVHFPGQDIKDIFDLLAHHVHQDGKDLVISGDGTEMILRNFDKGDLTVLDFAT